jgi:hypothetical protein
LLGAVYVTVATPLLLVVANSVDSDPQLKEE